VSALVGLNEYGPTPATRISLVDGRLSAAHLVNGIVLAEEVLAAGAVGPHIARSLGQVVSSYGPTIIPNIDAALEVLETGAGPRF
jgi:hypothetical protein